MTKDELIAILAVKDEELAVKDRELAVKDGELAMKDEELIAKDDPSYQKQKVQEHFDAVDEWRLEEIRLVYPPGVTEEDAITGKLWLNYTDLFNAARSCRQLGSDPFYVQTLALLAQQVQSPQFAWTEEHRRTFLAHYAYHTTGIEGNTLTLPETKLVIDGKELLAGFNNDDINIRTSVNVAEVNNIRYIIDAKGLADKPSLPAVIPFVPITLVELIDCNSFITRRCGTATGLRRENVGIGFKKVLLPQFIEVPKLMEYYIEWLNTSMKGLPNTVEDGDSLSAWVRLACDAHTRLVHIHPFADGNGRLARLVSALVLQRAGLPPVLFQKQETAEYMAAVSSATIDREYAALNDLHLKAIIAALVLMVKISTQT